VIVGVVLEADQELANLFIDHILSQCFFVAEELKLQKFHQIGYW
jgi:hypothetical protein